MMRPELCEPASEHVAKRTLEALIAELDEAASSGTMRPWPIAGISVGHFDEEQYRRACGKHVVPVHRFSIRRQLMKRSDTDFVVAAFKILVGGEPDCSVWHYYVTRLATGEITRDQLLSELRNLNGGDGRRIVLFEEQHLKAFLERTEVGLQDVVSLLAAFFRRQIAVRFASGVDRVRQFFGAW